jgi:type III pantothenate kinase
LADVLTNWATQAGVEFPMRRITYRDVPLAIRVDEPARVGIDRLLAALAADRIRQRDRAAIIVDLGSAITVDLLDASGAFCGGAILPGIAMSARALEEHTDALPRVALDHLEHPPEPIGQSTVPAIEAGLYWGAVGAVRELISQMSKNLPAPPDVILTGGASSNVAKLLEAGTSYSVRHLPHLVLSGIALVKP